MVGGLMDMVRHAGALAAEQQDIVRPIGKLGMADACLCGGQHETPAAVAPASLEGRPVDMPGHHGARDIIQSRPFQVPVGQREPRRLDDIDGEAEAGGKPEDRAGIAGDIRLVKGNAQGHGRCL